MPEVLEKPAETVTSPTETDSKVVIPTLAEVEAQYREAYDKKIGRDISKLVPAPAKKAEPAKIEETPKAETPAVETPKALEPAKKSKGGFARTVNRLNRLLGEEQATRKALESRLSALEKPQESTKPGTAVSEEPQRDKFPTIEEYITAIRKYDRESTIAEVRKDVKKIETDRESEAGIERWNAFVERRDELKKSLADFDEVVGASSVEFKEVVGGLIVSAGHESPKLLYDLAKDSKAAKRLNLLEADAVAAIGQSDDVAGMLKHFASTPGDIDKINGLTPPKAAKFIGILEARLEASVEKPKTEEKAPVPVAPASTKAEAPKPVAQVDVARRARPELPPKLTGSTPPAADWKESAEMSLAERERLWREDPQNRRR